MRIILLAILSLTWVTSIGAQIRATLDRSAAGVPELRIRNNSDVKLDAFAVALNPTPQAEDQTQFVAFSDPVVDDAASLEPGGERVIPVLQRSRPGKQLKDLFEPAALAAGIFADGTMAGDPVLLSRIMVRRCNMLLAVETSLEMLSDARKSDGERDNGSCVSWIYRWPEKRSLFPVAYQIAMGLASRMEAQRASRTLGRAVSQ